jgi:hypothetical protein
MAWGDPSICKACGAEHASHAMLKDGECRITRARCHERAAYRRQDAIVATFAAHVAGGNALEAPCQCGAAVEVLLADDVPYLMSDCAAGCELRADDGPYFAINGGLTSAALHFILRTGTTRIVEVSA